MNAVPLVQQSQDGPELFRVLDRNLAISGRFPLGRTNFFHAIESSGSASFADAIAQAIWHYASLEKIARFHDVYFFGSWGIPHEIAEHCAALQSRGEFYHFMTGHWIYGIHRYWCHPYMYSTVLRDPQTRFLSKYNYYRSKTPNPAPFRDIFAPRSALPQTQAYSLAFDRLELEQLRRRPSKEEVVDRALHNLDRDFVFVGITELFEESLYLFCDQFGLPSLLPWKRIQSIAGRPSVESLPKSEQELLAEAVAIDQPLYDLARKRLEAVLRGKDFGTSLEDYKRRNSAN